MDDGITLENEYWTLQIWPQWGANPGQLRHVPSGNNLLRWPNDVQRLYQEPYLFGMPLLFPAGRIAGGTCEIDGERWQWPQNDSAGPNHLHGFLWNQPFRVQELSATQCVLFPAPVTHNILTREMHQPIFLAIYYILRGTAVEMRVCFINQGSRAVPFGFGYHLNIALNTAWQVTLPAGRPWIMGSDIMPLRLASVHDALIPELSQSAIDPRNLVCDVCYTVSALDQNRLNLWDPDRGTRLVLRAPLPFRHWVMYRPHTSADFVSIEPYTWLHNAPNLPWDPSLTGMRMLQPGERVDTWLTWECTP